MADFDAEYHLRRHAEDELLLAEPGFAGDRARALVVLGLLTMNQARAICDPYRQARALRLGHRDDEDDLGPSAAPHSLRVIALGRTVDVPYGKLQLHHISFSGQRVRVPVTVTFDKPARAQLARPGRGPLLTLDVTDDQGSTETLDFSGGGGSTTWTGSFNALGRLSPTTSWIDVGGERIALVDEPPLATVSVRSIVGDDEPNVAIRAERHLAYCLRAEREDHWRPNALPAVLDTLIVSGALAVDCAVVQGARAVWAALSTGEVVDAQALPDHWRATLDPTAAAPSSRGPEAEILVGVATPVFDGITLGVGVLTSQRGHFEIDFDGAGTLSDRLVRPEHRELPVVCTAVDDLGNQYVGSSQQWHGGGNTFSATMRYHPALDPSAGRVDLVFTGSQTEAVVSVPLPRAAP